jgi:hypothetical protein
LAWHLLVRLQNETSQVVAAARATEILLTFHMLFINIVLINLLIAVFAWVPIWNYYFWGRMSSFSSCSDSIGKVQQNTEFYWRFQRYSFVREYFQRPILAYPPLTIIPHLILLSCAIKHKFCSKLSQNQLDDGDNVSISKRMTPIFSEC